MADLHIHDPTIKYFRGDYFVRPIDALRVEATDGELTARSVAPRGALGRSRASSHATDRHLRAPRYLVSSQRLDRQWLERHRTGQARRRIESRELTDQLAGPAEVGRP